MPSITRRTSSTASRRARAEEKILAATQRLLTDGTTFTELGVQQIATEAHVARSTFYTHFEDKSALLMRLVAATLDTSFGVTSVWTPEGGVTGLTETFTRVVAGHRENAAVLRAIAEVATYDATVRDFWNEELDRFTESTAAILRTEQHESRTPSNVDATLASRLIVSGGQRAIVDHVSQRPDSEDEAFAGELAATWWYGVYRRPESEQG
jgi:AcrR family transcriptional regulator